MQKGAPAADPALITGRLNVNDYVAARKDDIRVLERLVASAGSKSKKRAFQSLPRTERRRAASHDAKRVPRKHGLRKRAELENLHANAKRPKSSARPRAPPRPPAHVDRAAFNERARLPPDGHGVRFADRQRAKTWLPTHIWHKKRAFVEQLAGFMVPVTATQKQYRRTHRLGANRDEIGVMAWDTSFYATIVVEDAPNAPHLDALLNQVCPGAAAPLYKTGAKHWQGLFSQAGPVIVHWLRRNRLAILCHPLLFDKIWDYLARAQASGATLQLQDATYAVGSIDLLGDSALAVLADTLLPTPDPENAAVASQWERLASTRSTNALPSRSTFDYLARDPRLFGKRFKRHTAAADTPISFSNADMELVRGRVYDPESRQTSLAGLARQSDVDARKQEPVTFAPDSDARVPVSVLVLDDSRIRILLPWSWVLPTWLTIFTRKHAMIGGQKELHQLAFERQYPFYPFDFPQIALSPELVENAPRTHSHRNAEISRPSAVAAFQPSMSSKDLKIARIQVTGRGNPGPGSAVYEVSDADAQRWLNAPSCTELVLESHSDELLLGVMTSGGFNLVKARGTGMALIREPAKRSSAKYCVVGDKKQNVWRLAEYKFVSSEECACVV